MTFTESLQESLCTSRAATTRPVTLQELCAPEAGKKQPGHAFIPNRIAGGSKFHAHVRVYMHMLIHVCVQTHPRCTTSVCTHLCTNGVTRGTQRSLLRANNHLLLSLVPSLPAGLAASPQIFSPLHEPIATFSQFNSHCSPHASSMRTQQTLLLRGAIPGTVLCSRAITKITPA